MPQRSDMAVAAYDAHRQARQQQTHVHKETVTHSAQRAVNAYRDTDEFERREQITQMMGIDTYA